jgi:hypothetical protein
MRQSLAWPIVLCVFCECGGDANVQATRDGGTSEEFSGCDPDASLRCVDRCGSPIPALCPAGWWVCPPAVASSTCSADGGPLGVTCGSGRCAAGMICENLGLANISEAFDAALLWACGPVPEQCLGDATCDCVAPITGDYVCAKDIYGVGCTTYDAGLTVTCVVP